MPSPKNKSLYERVKRNANVNLRFGQVRMQVHGL